jgi:hypothetical protein
MATGTIVLIVVVAVAAILLIKWACEGGAGDPGHA